MTTNNMERSHNVETSDTIEAIEECYRMGWSDGLPVVPPVDYKVREMLEMSGLTGGEEILSLEMRNRVLTSENVAANAVMAATKIAVTTPATRKDWLSSAGLLGRFARIFSNPFVDTADTQRIAYLTTVRPHQHDQVKLG